jgi:hypothetical protein
MPQVDARSCPVPPAGFEPVPPPPEPTKSSRPSSRSCRRPGSTDRRESVEGRFVGIRKRVQVLLGGSDRAVAETFLHNLEVGATGQKPGGVCVAKVVGADVSLEIGTPDGR